MMVIADEKHLPTYLSTVLSNVLAIWEVLMTLTVIMYSLISNKWAILDHM